MTSQAIPDSDTLKSAQRSYHRELMLETAQKGSSGKLIPAPKPEYAAFGDWASIFQYSCVSVVDFNGDGLDDIYLSDRWKPALLLQNEGEGTFRNVAEEVGLTVDELGSSALFADFDNDGDPDVLVCRVLKPCLFFENVEGKFTQDRRNTFALREAKFVVSGSVVDINNDGLLDVYLNTYVLGNPYKTEWKKEVTAQKYFLEFALKMQEQHSFLDRRGPPNLVYMNHGGFLKEAETSDALKQWRTTFQSVFSDFDNDGDPDLYVCNDFAKDAVLRNDTKRGDMNVKFTDISDEVSPDGVMAYAMGASFGDFNNDGQLDLYVSNMYSKAGNRIVDQLENPDPRIGISAVGNFLYARDGTSLRQVAGSEEGQQHVSEVGWSFGAQFADFDNDGKLDLYVPSGNYTAPEELETEEDL